MSNTINTNQLRAMLQGKTDVLVLDVLPKVAFDKDHIEGARNVPMDSPNFLRDVEWLTASKDKKIVVYCASEACGTSGDAVQKLTAAGHTDVVKYEGGIEAWRQQGSNSSARDGTGTVPATKAKERTAHAEDEGDDDASVAEDYEAKPQGKSNVR